MGIEALSGMMQYQAQTVPKTVKAETENMDGSVRETALPTENADVQVNRLEEKDTDKNGKEQQPSNEQVKKAVDSLNKKMKNSEAIFGIHDGTNRVTIKIIDKDTRETIKELPPEKTLDMIAKAWELAGILVDERR